MTSMNEDGSAADLPDDATIAREAGALGRGGPAAAPLGVGGGSPGGGINGAELAGREDALGGTGGSAGGGGLSGGGDVSGGEAGAAGSLSGFAEDMGGHAPGVPTRATGGLGEALGTGAGRDVGSGTSGDRGELGGGGSDALTGTGGDGA